MCRFDWIFICFGIFLCVCISGVYMCLSAREGVCRLLLFCFILLFLLCHWNQQYSSLEKSTSLEDLISERQVYFHHWLFSYFLYLHCLSFSLDPSSHSSARKLFSRSLKLRRQLTSYDVTLLAGTRGTTRGYGRSWTRPTYANFTESWFLYIASHKVFLFFWDLGLTSFVFPGRFIRSRVWQEKGNVT